MRERKGESKGAGYAPLNILRRSMNKAGCILINKELKKINSNEICYIEADGKYSNIHLSDKIMHCSKTLAGVTKLLPAYCFVKTHRAFVVNLHYIKSYSSDTVYLSNGESAFLSKNYQKSFQTSYMNFLKKNYVRL